MISLVVGVICFFAGLVVGVTFKSMAFESQDWKVMKWNKDTLGYRPVSPGSMLSRGDRVAMSLEIDSSKFPKEGIKYEL